MGRKQSPSKLARTHLLTKNAVERLWRLVVDDRGRLLYVEFSKTDAGNRALAVPEVLQRDLAKLAEGKQPDEPLFTSSTPREHAQSQELADPMACAAAAGVEDVPPFDGRLAIDRSQGFQVSWSLDQTPNELVMLTIRQTCNSPPT